MLCDYTAGLVSGFVSVLIGHPLDTIKTQQQLRSISFTAAAKRIYFHRGWRGYFRGLTAPLFANGALNAVFFGIYGDLRDYLVAKRIDSIEYWALRDQLHATQRVSEEEHLLKNKLDALKKQNQQIRQATFNELFISGTVAGMVTILISAPIELVKTKLQSQMKRTLFKGPVDCLLTVTREAGIRGLFRGFVPLSYRDGIGGGLYMIGYEGFKEIIRKVYGPTPKATESIIAGGLAGVYFTNSISFETYDAFDIQAFLSINIIGTGVNYVVICSMLRLCEDDVFPSSKLQTLFTTGVAGISNWAIVLPFDTIKTRMQGDDHKNPRYRSMLHVAQEIHKKDGIIGLYRGFWSVSARAFPVNASIFLVYEFLQHRLCDR